MRPSEQQFVSEIKKKINHDSCKKNKNQIERNDRNNKDPNIVIFQ